MVLMSGPARHNSSLCNRTNVCGGSKKAGTGPMIGWTLMSNPNMLRVNKSNPVLCISVKGHPVQRTGYRATLGR